MLDTGCLALENATFGGPADGRIQQGEDTGYCLPAIALAQARRAKMLEKI